MGEFGETLQETSVNLHEFIDLIIGGLCGKREKGVGERNVIHFPEKKLQLNILQYARWLYFLIIRFFEIDF